MVQICNIAFCLCLCCWVKYFFSDLWNDHMIHYYLEDSKKSYDLKTFPSINILEYFSSRFSCEFRSNLTFCKTTIICYYFGTDAPYNLQEFISKSVKLKIIINLFASNANSKRFHYIYSKLLVILYRYKNSFNLYYLSTSYQH